MELLRTLWKATFGLFVDDGSFALTIVIWAALVKTLLSRTAVMRDGGMGASCSWALL
jgi:hypothetical protein